MNDNGCVIEIDINDPSLQVINNVSTYDIEALEAKSARDRAIAEFAQRWGSGVRPRQGTAVVGAL